jgi:hypothetical protein
MGNLMPFLFALLLVAVALARGAIAVRAKRASGTRT